MSQKNGKATIYGLDQATLTGYVAIYESQSFNHKAEISTTKDGDGNDNSAKATNEYIEARFEFRPSGASIAAAKGTVFFIAPLATIAVAGIGSGPQAAVGDVDRSFNGDWIYWGDATVTFKPGEDATMSLPVRKYVSVTQNTLMKTATTAGA